MSDVMVTARMSKSKKEAGKRALEALGVSPSAAINRMYDYVIAHKELPFERSSAPSRHVSKEDLQRALNEVRSIAIVDRGDFYISDPESLKRERLISRGYATESDFE